MKYLLFFLLASSQLCFSQDVMKKNQLSEEEKIFQHFEQMKQKMLKDFFSDDFFNKKGALQNDLYDDEFFKDMDLMGGDLKTESAFDYNWEEDQLDKVSGVSLYIDPKNKEIPLEIKVEGDAVHISGKSKVESNGKVGKSVAENQFKQIIGIDPSLDIKKHKILKAGQRIRIFFPFLELKTRSAPQKSQKSTPLFKPQKGDDVI